LPFTYTLEELQAGAQATAADAWIVGTEVAVNATMAPAHKARRRDFFTASPPITVRKLSKRKLKRR
jgi:hypothetical protein